MKKIMSSVVALLALTGAYTVAGAEDGINVFSDIKLDGEIRPRYEFVDDGKVTTANANAYTARLKLKATANLLEIEGLSTSIGVISVNNFGSNTYNWNGTNYNDGSKNYSTVVDPQTAMVSNAELNYKMGKTLFHIGRSQVNLDNQRFIGTVGWRQFERSYDTVFVSDESVENLSLLAAWVYGIQGVKENPTTDTNSILLHAAYKVNDMLKVTAYDYMIADAYDTVGFALTGDISADFSKFDYRAEFAQQNDATMNIHGGAKTQADASYYNLDFGANISGVIAGVNYEFLSGTTGSDGKTAFNPSLGTNHKFNGWADMFYVASVPQGGLKDFNVRLGYTNKEFGKLLAVYHQFTADKNMAAASGTTDDLGSEFDVLYAHSLPFVKDISALIKYASYSKGKATGYTNDVEKMWVMLDYKFSIK
ncbi:hypothetical protein [Sulfurimonas sp. C5]|uniref:hypothetical protein n=1 Tax=Sulfurimonas sp. C5 TaxID=3036947 RepID=UPI002454AD87|nr:hypothetical protein [Sulfurimonas sp. C5]MDH4944170.1 hypothetical protein [Sulfurimonas sp. C5]